MLLFSHREMREGLAELIGIALVVFIIGSAFFFILSLITTFALPALAFVAPVFLLLAGAMMVEQKMQRGGLIMVGIAVLLACFCWPWANQKFFVETGVPRPYGSQSTWRGYYEALDEAGFSNLELDVRGGPGSPECRVVTATPSPGHRMDPSETLSVVLDCP